jgi:hypothetical protein
MYMYIYIITPTPDLQKQARSAPRMPLFLPLFKLLIFFTIKLCNNFFYFVITMKV